jgi:small-conductance mechanosensitive channel
MQESNAIKVKSEVALCAMELLDNAGIEIPFPQRDLRLRAVDTDAAATLLAPTSEHLSSAHNGDEPVPRLITEPANPRPLEKE